MRIRVHPRVWLGLGSGVGVGFDSELGLGLGLGVGVGLECIRGPVSEPIDGGTRDEGREHAHIVAEGLTHWGAANGDVLHLVRG